MVCFSAGSRHFSLLQGIQIGCGPTVFNWKHTGFLGVKWYECKFDYSPLSYAQINAWTCTSTPQCGFMVWCWLSTQMSLPFFSHFSNLRVEEGGGGWYGTLR